MGFFERFFSKEKENDLQQSLSKTKEGFFDKLTKAIAGRTEIDDDFLDALEQILISSDVGLDTTIKIIQRIQTRAAKDKYLGTDQLNEILKDEIFQLLSENILIRFHCLQDLCATRQD